MELRAKIILITILVLILTVGISNNLFMRFQQQRLIESKITDVEFLGSIIHGGIEDAMSSGETEMVQRILENMGRNPDILSLRILSPEGHILKSKSPQEIGLGSKSYQDRQRQHLNRRSFVDGGSITYFSPVPNRQACHGCHASDIDLNGIVEIEIDISRSRGEIIAARRGLVVSGAATVLTIVVILSLMIDRMVLRPIAIFRKAMRSVQEGNLDTRLPAGPMDDLGELSRSFNRMLDKVRSLQSLSRKKERDVSRVRDELTHKALLEELNAELQGKISEVENANKAVIKLSREVKSKNLALEGIVDRLKKINEIGRVLASVIDNAELMKVIARTSTDIMGAVTASIYLTRGRDRNTAMIYRSRSGIELLDIPAEEINPLYPEIFNEGRPVIVNEVHPGDEARGLEAGQRHIGGPLKMKGKVVGGIVISRNADADPFAHDDLEILDTISNKAIVALENSWLYETIKNNYFGTIQSLVNALEASDRYTKGHSERVRFMVLELARYIGLDPRELEVLEHAAILHDIGKIGIDNAVLNKEGSLSAAEFNLIKSHPIIGDEILGPIGTLQGVRTTILQHHERYDGRGYPYGIAGEEITLKARLLAVIDTFDAMVSDRPYRKALSFENVLTELNKGSATQFDPAILSAFLEMVRERDSLLDEAGYSIN